MGKSLREQFAGWTDADIAQHNERVAQGKAKARGSDRDTGEAPKLEPDPSDGAVVAIQIQKATGARFLVRIKSIRKRLIDQDNLCSKYATDLCRYSGIIPDDSPTTTQLETSQQKARKGQAETVRIEIYEIQEEDLTQPTLL